MHKKDQEKINLRQPKIYNPPKDERTSTIPKYTIIIILFLIISISITYILIFSPLFKISTVDIKGNLSEEAIVYLNQFKNQNLFLVRSRLISSKLQYQNPQYLNIEVYKGIPNILRVEANERIPAFAWQTQGLYYLVDRNGLAYKNIEQNEINNITLVIDNKNLPLDLPKQVVTANFSKFISDAKLKIKEVNLDVQNFQINETSFQVDALTTAGIKIIFDTTRSLTDQMDAFNYVYKDHQNEITQYVDTRVEGKIYYQ